MNTVFFTHDELQQQLVMASVKTVWGRCVSTPTLPPVPVRIVISGAIGDPQKPAKTIDHELQFNWVFSENVSDQVFDTEELIYAPDLQEAILDHAEQLRILETPA